MSKQRMSDRDKAQSNIGADYFLAPGGGGIAIWVRRDELVPRCAVRFRPIGEKQYENIDVTETATLLASLHVGLGKLTMMLAEQHGIEAEVLAEMCDVALNELGPHMDVATEIRGKDSK